MRSFAIFTVSWLVCMALSGRMFGEVGFAVSVLFGWLPGCFAVIIVNGCVEARDERERLVKLKAKMEAASPSEQAAKAAANGLAESRARTAEEAAKRAADRRLRSTPETKMQAVQDYSAVITKCSALVKEHIPVVQAQIRNIKYGLEPSRTDAETLIKSCEEINQCRESLVSTWAALQAELQPEDVAQFPQGTELLGVMGTLTEQVKTLVQRAVQAQTAAEPDLSSLEFALDRLRDVASSANLSGDYAVSKYQMPFGGPEKLIVRKV
jgi:hypothetical protein